MTEVKILLLTPNSSILLINALTSLGKQEPQKPAPACRKDGPILLSKPIPRATSLISAPALSHILDSSFIKDIRVASMELLAYLISSDVLTLVKTSGRSLLVMPL